MTASRVTIVDYGLGNLFSLSRAFQHIGAEVEISSDPTVVAKAGLLVLPGVGAFGDGMAHLKQQNLLEPVIAHARQGRPLMGICLGMQLLFTESEEFGRHAGLNLIEGSVKKMSTRDAQGARVKVPHYGWDGLSVGPQRGQWQGTVLDGLNPGDYFYFVHSFAAFPADPGVVIADVRYGDSRYTAAVQSGLVMGCQFHPEKSGEAGLTILKNFLKSMT